MGNITTTNRMAILDLIAQADETTEVAGLSASVTQLQVDVAGLSASVAGLTGGGGGIPGLENFISVDTALGIATFSSGNSFLQLDPNNEIGGNRFEANDGSGNSTGIIVAIDQLFINATQGSEYTENLTAYSGNTFITTDEVSSTTISQDLTSITSTVTDGNTNTSSITIDKDNGVLISDYNSIMPGKATTISVKTSNGVIVSIINIGGTPLIGYASSTVTFSQYASSGSGSGLSISFDFDGSGDVTSYNILNGGVNYKSGDTIQTTDEGSGYLTFEINSVDDKSITSSVDGLANNTVITQTDYDITSTISQPMYAPLKQNLFTQTIDGSTIQLQGDNDTSIMMIDNNSISLTSSHYDSEEDITSTTSIDMNSSITDKVKIYTHVGNRTSTSTFQVSQIENVVSFNNDTSTTRINPDNILSSSVNSVTTIDIYGGTQAYSTSLLWDADAEFWYVDLGLDASSYFNEINNVTLYFPSENVWFSKSVNPNTYLGNTTVYFSYGTPFSQLDSYSASTAYVITPALGGDGSYTIPNKTTTTTTTGAETLSPTYNEISNGDGSNSSLFYTSLNSAGSQWTDGTINVTTGVGTSMGSPFNKMRIANGAQVTEHMLNDLQITSSVTDGTDTSTQTITPTDITSTITDGTNTNQIYADKTYYSLVINDNMIGSIGNTQEYMNSYYMGRITSSGGLDLRTRMDYTSGEIFSSIIDASTGTTYSITKIDTTSATTMVSDGVDTSSITIEPSSITLGGIPSFDDDTAAGTGGLTTGMIYQTTGGGASPLDVAGILMIKQ